MNNIKDCLIAKQEQWECDNGKDFYDLPSNLQDELFKKWELELAEDMVNMGDE